MSLRALIRLLPRRPTLPVHSVQLVRRYCQEPPGSSGLPPEPLSTMARFENGLITFNVGSKSFVVSHLTPVASLSTILGGTAQPETQAKQQEADAVAAASVESTMEWPTAGSPVLAKPSTQLIGLALSEGPVKLSHDVILELEGVVPPEIAQPPTFGEALLEGERENIMATYSPMSQQFKDLLMKAEGEANNRFKWGGLFLLSAQLGFVARLTWFEYSWDIMEPITWCLTYTMLVASFSYYILTSQEYMLPLVERRVIQNQFWKNVKKNQFDVTEFRRLREQLLSVEARMATRKGGKFPNFQPF